MGYLNLRSPTTFICPRCTRKLAWNKQGQWGGGDFGFLFCSSHRFPLVWGIPIVLDQPPVPFLLLLVEQGRFSESLELALASSVPKEIGDFDRRRKWARGIFPLERASFEKAMTPFPKSWRSFFQGRFRDPSFKRLCALAREMTKKKKGVLLDLGCGTAPLAYALNGRSSQVEIISLDINFYLLYFARRFFRTNSLYVCADVRQRLPFSSQSSGAIVCSGVSQAIQDQAHFLAECRRLLDPSGVLCWQP